MDEKLIMKILDSKEARGEFQKRLIEEFQNTVISFTLNTPGSEKDNKRYRIVHKYAMEFILESLKEKEIDILYKYRDDKFTGPEGYIVVDRDAFEIKEMMIDIEETHFLGRIFDIDVFDKDMNQISRTDLNINTRKCLLCSKNARVCMRERTHTIGKLAEKVNKMIMEYLDLTKK